ncbi:hypothetical protein HU200_047259 [Digitaria exilis]|uniref:Homeobox domain-containing protein n=1 Tax=Digitaria exilis TaxID=1010633 RepID=A0A835EDT9_9POAL|nr:hypothetical protein HU200_047259 [Digitaria exilis]
MASSFNNRHWPSMFRSKHAAEPWQAHPDVSSSPPPNLLSGAAGNNTAATGSCLKHTSSGYAGGEERSADPKPRWNPRPEQIRILEAIFNSGMVNPPRDEIPRIRMRLQEYGHVGDANVFYWFQNRKSRSKNKLRSSASYAAARPCPARARASSTAAPPPVTPPPPPQQQLLNQQQFHLLAAASPVQAAAVAPTSSSSSSSSDRSSGSSKPAAKRAAAQAMSSPTAAAMDLLGPLAAACPTQMYYHQGHQPMAPPAHKAQQDLVVASEIFQQWPQGYCLSAGEVAAILGGGHGQYMHQHVPVVQQQQPPALPTAGASFLGLCNEVTVPATITGGGQRTCNNNWGAAGIGQYGPSGGSGDHLQIGKNAAATNAVAGREEAHEDATKLGLLQYCFGGDSTSVDAASVAVSSSPLTATPEAATVTVASGLPAANTAAATNGVIADYDLLQLQGMHAGLAAADGALGVTTTTTGAAPVAAAPTAQEEAGGVAALCITDSLTGRSVAYSVAAARLDVRAQFGEAALLFRCAGERGLDLEPVVVDASSGCTVHPLQHGAFYYVLV